MICSRRLFALLPTIFIPTYAEAQASAPNLSPILSAVDHICQRPASVGVSRSVGGEVSGKVNLNSVLKRLADAGVTARGKVEQRNWAGVTQADMARAIADSNGCAERMFTLMFKRFYVDQGARPAASRNSAVAGPVVKESFPTTSSPGRGVRTASPKNPTTESQDAQEGTSLLSGFNIMMPRGDKVIVTWEGMGNGSGEGLLKVAGISLTDLNRGARMAYSALAQRSPDSISFYPFFAADGSKLPGFNQAVLNPGPIPGALYTEFQLFQGDREFKIFLTPISEHQPVIDAQKVGIRWDDLKSGLAMMLKALSKGKKDYDFDGVAVTQSASGLWNYSLSFREL